MGYPYTYTTTMYVSPCGQHITSTVEVTGEHNTKSVWPCGCIEHENEYGGRKEPCNREIKPGEYK